MKVAFTIWNGRISPVFDTARELLLLELEDDRIVSETHEQLPDADAARCVAKLHDLGISTLVCGAISRPMADMLAACGIRLMPFVAGDIMAVVAAYRNRQLPNATFMMPGCCTPGRRRMGRRCTTQENDTMFGGKGKGQGTGKGMGSGKGQGGKGRMGGAMAGGPSGMCLCPKCNEQIAHQRGVPCSEQTCPKCGGPLVRAH